MSDSEEENQDFSPNSRALITLSPHTAADMDLDLDGSWPFDQISSNPTSLICLPPSNQPCSSTWFFPDDNARNTTSTLVTDTGNRDSINESPAESGDNRRLPPPLRLTRLDYPDWSCAIKGRMAQALRCFKESTDQNVLAQVWAPVKSGDRYVLTTSGQPFVLDPRSNGLYQYRMASVMYMFSAGGERGGALGLPGRVFQQKMPEWTPNVQYYSSKEYPRLTYALNYNVQGSLALPVFEPSGQSCVGVFELIMTSPKINYAPEVDKVCKALEAVNLRSSEILDHPSTQICNEGRQEALVEILEILTVVCETHKLPLAQTWVPCRHRSVLAYGGGLKKTCSSFDGGCMEQVCMSTTDVAFYVVDAHMWGFREACSEHHLQKGQGVAGRAFESLNSCFCKDITQFCKTEYPLVHYARMFGLTSSFAICLRSTHTGSDDYILEFFLPPDIRDNREQHTLLDSIFLTMKQHFRSLKVASGKELEEEGTCVEIIEESMDEKLESMLQCIEMPQSDRSSLHLEAFSNEGDIMQLDSSETQSFEEFDATNITGKVVGADKSCTTISHQENKNTIKRLERKCRIAENEISLEVLQQHFDCKRLDVAKKLGVSVSTLKHVMRKHGIRRWPFRNKKIECSLFEPKLVTEFVHGAVGSFSPPTSSHTDVVGSSYPNSQGSKPPEPRIEKKMLSLFVGQAKIADQMLSAHEGQLQVQNRFHLHRQDARIVTLKATYGKTIVKLKLSSTSGIVELKEELAKKLKLEHGSFNVNYQDEDLEWILIACDADLYDCVTSSTSMGNQVIRLLVLDKVVNSKNSNKALEQHMAILPHTVPHAMTRNNAVTVTTLQVETDKSSLLSPQCLSGSIAQDNLAQSCPVPTLVTMDECFLEAERCINSSIELPCSNPALKLPTVTTAQTEIVDQMLESSHSAPKGQLQEQNRFHLQKQNARTATIKATYGDKTVRVPPPATSGIVKLKEELARRLELEHGSFYVEYEDEDHDWILIACDDVLQECLTFSRDNRVIRLAVRDEVVNSLRIPAKL